MDDDDGFDVSINDDDCFDEDCVNHVLVDEYFSTEEMSGAGLFCPVSNASSHLQEVACTRSFWAFLISFTSTLITPGFLVRM